MQKKKAELAGSWYRGDAKSLAKEVDACLLEGRTLFGAAVPGKGKPVAAVVPHAGLSFSGPVAGLAYQLIRETMPRVDTFLVFGASHRARLARPALWTGGAWETPLGDIEIDRQLAGMLEEAGVGDAAAAPFMGDNSIELQTPFIKRMFPEALIMPVAMSFFKDSWRLGEVAADAAERAGRVVMAVASTDLTHYGAAFGVMPAGIGQPALEWTRDNDNRFLKTLVDMDVENIVPTAERDGSACGAGAAAAAAGWARRRGCGRGRLLAHTNSHEILPRGEAEHLVGYASLVYEDA